MGTSEELRETLVALQRENERLRAEKLEANLLLHALNSLLRLQIDEDPFPSVFESLYDLFAFEQAMVLVERDDRSLACVAANQSRLLGYRFPIGAFFKKIMNGRVATTFDNGALEEWEQVPGAEISRRQPALYLPIAVRDRHGILVLLRGPAQEPFDRAHVALAKKFSVLASHALAVKHTSQLIHASETRALAAEEASRIKNLFIANMSHELRTPLNAIIGFSEIIQGEQFGSVGNTRYVEYAGDILMSGRHLLGVINNMLLHSTIEAGHHKVDVERIVIDHEIAYATRMLQVEAERSSIKLSYETTALPMEVLADQRSLRQILVNVVGNAIKFSPAKGEVGIKTKPGSAHCHLLIVDRGCGIPAATLQQLGQPFVHGDGTFNRRHQGTGLGIAICFRLAQAMGAQLAFESREGAGTTVTLTLPLAP